MGKGGCSDLYTLSRMMFIVSSTGTFVNRFSTSRDAISSPGVHVCNRSMNSTGDVHIFSVGMYGVRSLLSVFAVSYVGVVIWAMMGRTGLSCLWVLIVPYR